MHSADRWRDLAELLPIDWELFVLELPGFGLSSIEPATNCSISIYAQMLEETIAELRDETRCSMLVAHSLGGLVALSFRSNFFDCEVYSAVPACDLPDDLWILGNERLTRFCLRLNGALPQRLARVIARRAARLTVSDRTLVDDLMVEDALRADPYAAARTAREMYCFALDQCRIDQRGACCVVHAECDRIVSMENSRQLATFLDAELVTISGSGHTLMSEVPEEFAALMVRLAQGARGSRP
jgi:pimeloyl-ACP methyl ester carboxylesterase